MKKLLDIIKLSELHSCFQLEIDFKTQRHNLKRYLKSLKELKTRSKADHQYFANLIKTSNEIIDDQGTIKKKNSELDYYMVNGVKLFKAHNSEVQKLDKFYEDLFFKTKDLIERLIKYLDQSKQSFTRVSSEHEKTVKDYAQKCFPETTTILYILGFVNLEKIKKIQDMMKQQGILKESEMYITILNTYLDQMENLKNQATDLFKKYYMGATELWMSCNEEFQKELGTYQIKDDQVEAYYKETRGAATDRSDRSSKGNHHDQHEEDV